MWWAGGKEIGFETPFFLHRSSHFSASNPKVGKESDFLFRISGQLGSYQSEKKERQILFSDFEFREIGTFVGL
ncbi:hypothetical protein GQ457_01G018140 [Hibiscus cannabinus]